MSESPLHPADFRPHTIVMKTAFALLSMLTALAQAGGLEFKELTKEQSIAVDATTATTDFEFTNTGDKAVTITKSDPNCSCLAVEISGGKLKYQPGESGVIRTTFDVGNASGTVDKGVAVWLDDDPADKPSVFLQVNIHVPVLVTLEPKTLSWSLGGTLEPKTIQIRIAEGNSINVVDVKSKDTFTCELKTLEKGRSYDLVVTPKSIDSPELGIIRIETDSKVAKLKVQQAFAVVRKMSPEAAEVTRK